MKFLIGFFFPLLSWGQWSTWPLENPFLPVQLPRVPESILTSAYGLRVQEQGTVNADYDFHRGVDLKAPVGTPVYAQAAGMVRFVNLTNTPGAGLWLAVDFSGNVTCRYLHLDSILVQAGDFVDSGDMVAYSGVSGGVAAHLHFETVYFNPDSNIFDNPTLRDQARQPLQYLPPLDSVGQQTYQGRTVAFLITPVSGGKQTFADIILGADGRADVLGFGIYHRDSIVWGKGIYEIRYNERTNWQAYDPKFGSLVNREKPRAVTFIDPNQDYSFSTRFWKVRVDSLTELTGIPFTDWETQPWVAGVLYADGVFIHSAPSAGVEERRTDGFFHFFCNPSPFNSNLTIQFYLSQNSFVRLELFDVLGQKIASLASSPYSMGWQKFYWGGSSMTGRSVPSGIYIVRLQAGQSVFLQKAVLNK